LCLLTTLFGCFLCRHFFARLLLLLNNFLRLLFGCYRFLYSNFRWNTLFFLGFILGFGLLGWLLFGRVVQLIFFFKSVLPSPWLTDNCFGFFWLFWFLLSLLCSLMFDLFRLSQNIDCWQDYLLPVEFCHFLLDLAGGKGRQFYLFLFFLIFCQHFLDSHSQVFILTRRVFTISLLFYNWNTWWLFPWLKGGFDTFNFIFLCNWLCGLLLFYWFHQQSLSLNLVYFIYMIVWLFNLHFHIIIFPVRWKYLLFFLAYLSFVWTLLRLRALTGLFFLRFFFHLRIFLYFLLEMFLASLFFICLRTLLTLIIFFCYFSILMLSFCFSLYSFCRRTALF
jgi:hypothetical protein